MESLKRKLVNKGGNLVYNNKTKTKYIIEKAKYLCHLPSLTEAIFSEKHFVRY